MQLLRLRLLEKYQDCGYGRCLFKHRKISQIIKESLLYFNEQRYKIISWVIMPNHIHLLVRLNKDNELSRFIHCLKSTNTNRINKLLCTADKIWSKDYFDRYIRDYSHYCKTIKYIELNPVKAGLCRSYEEWEFSSGYRNTKGSQTSVPESLEEPLLSLAGTEACDP